MGGDTHDIVWRLFLRLKNRLGKAHDKGSDITIHVISSSIHNFSPSIFTVRTFVHACANQSNVLYWTKQNKKSERLSKLRLCDIRKATNGYIENKFCDIQYDMISAQLIVRMILLLALRRRLIYCKDSSTVAAATSSDFCLAFLPSLSPLRGGPYGPWGRHAFQVLSAVSLRIACKEYRLISRCIFRNLDIR